MSLVIYTIGHSNHSLECFIDLLRKHDIQAVADVRSAPYSGWTPQFNRKPLEAGLKKEGIAYVFLGAELGARSDDPSCYAEGRVRFERLAETAAFKAGVERLLEGAKRYRIALMCAEKDPIVCHRGVLVSRRLAERGARVRHILEDGSLETHEEALSRMLDQFRLPEGDLVSSRDEMAAHAYELQGARIAHRGDEPVDAAPEREKSLVS